MQAFPLESNASTEEYQEGQEEAEDKEEKIEIGTAPGHIALREFSAASFLSLSRDIRVDSGRTIESSYDAGLVQSKHRLHDLMVIHIANVCQAKGATVWDDPNTVDLLVAFKGMEFLVEVKSVTSRNFVHRVRTAIGQVLQYDYFRAQESAVPRRKVIALAAQLPHQSWCVPFVSEHLSMDLLSLHNQLLRVDSTLPLAMELFSTPSSLSLPL